MFPNLLSPSPLVWAGLAGSMVALPILIHLINMLRHRRVKWAAMDFLLQSYQRNRNWIWLKQLLLLLTRIAALIAVLFMVAQVGCQNDQLARLEGTQPTHHYILLDDSYSMAERSAGQQLFDRARETVQMLVARAGNRRDQKITLIRYSQAQFSATQQSLRESDSASTTNEVAPLDVDGVDIDSSIGALMDDQLGAIEVTALTVGPEAGLELIEQQIQSRSNEQAIVYVVSDFRQKDWGQPTDTRGVLDRIRKADGQIHLINCVRESAQNLAVIELAPVSGMNLANVPMFMRLTIKNLGEEKAENVQVRLHQELFSARDANRREPGQWEPTIEELPTAFFEEIAGNSEVTQEFPVFLPSDGDHVIVATLEDDALTTDNLRQSVIRCRPVANVMIVEEGAAEASYFLQTAFQPGRRSTGIQSSIRSMAEVDRMDEAGLREFDSIILVDPFRCKQSTVERLGRYVENGGGITIYAGENTDRAFMNASFYREGEFLLPMPLDDVVELPELIDDTAADIVPSNHPLFRAFAESRNSPLDLVTLRKYTKPPSGWEPPSDSGIETLATIRDANGSPLILSKSFGNGRVTLVNTSCGPTWHDWTSNPTFVVCTLLLQEFSLRNVDADLNRQIAYPFELELDSEAYRPTIRVVKPGVTKETIELSAEADETAVESFRFQFGNQAEPPFALQTSELGVYEVWLTKRTEEMEVVRWATHVEPNEGRLAIARQDDMLKQLASVRPKLEYWDEITSDARRDLSPPLAKWLIVIVLLGLMCEQLLAYLTSYHPARGEARS